MSKILKESRKVSILKEQEIYNDGPSIIDFTVMFKFLNKEGSWK